MILYRIVLDSIVLYCYPMVLYVLFCVGLQLLKRVSISDSLLNSVSKKVHFSIIMSFDIRQTL